MINQLIITSLLLFSFHFMNDWIETSGSSRRSVLLHISSYPAALPLPLVIKSLLLQRFGSSELRLVPLIISQNKMAYKAFFRAFKNLELKQLRSYAFIMPWTDVKLKLFSSTILFSIYSVGNRSSYFHLNRLSTIYPSKTKKNTSGIMQILSEKHSIFIVCDWSPSFMGQCSSLGVIYPG